MAGLLDFLTTDPDQQRAITQGLLSGAFGAMAGRGSRLQAWGQGGLAGLQGYSSSLDRTAMDKQQAAQLQRQKMLDQLAQYQVQQAERENQIAQLPQQFVQPARIAPEMDARDIGTPGAAPTIPAAFDTQGYLNALRGMDPMRAMQMEAAMQKQTPTPIKLGANERLLSPDGQKEIVPAMPDSGKQSPIGQLISEMNALPPGDPRRAIYQQAIQKASTHQPPVSLNNYGSPLPIDLGGGRTGYIQPPPRPGGPSQIVTIPGTNSPAIKPPDGGAKDLTEAQAKATAFLGQMRSASESLKAIGADQTVLSTQAETALAGGPMNALIGQKAQRIRQAQDQWSEAFLRFKTGAASTEEEVRRNNRTFFPQIGDKPEQIAQKAAARAQAERDMEIAAGRGTGQLNARDGGGMPSQSAIDAEIARRAQARGGR